MARLQDALMRIRPIFATQIAAFSQGGVRGVIAGLKRADRVRQLQALRVLLVALLAVQALRVALPAARAEWLLRSAAVEREEESREKFREPLDKFKPILEKGVLGIPPREAPPQLFGVLGRTALIGGAPEQVQEFSEGATLPSGEKVVRVGVDSVDLEKDGQKQTLTVFPDLKAQPQ